MDYKELAKNLMICAAVESGCICPGEYRGEVCSGPREESGDCMRMDELASTAITDLLTRAEAAEARCETLEKMVKEYQDELIPGYRERAEKAEMERDAAVSDLKRFGQCGACKNYYRTDACGSGPHSYCDGGFVWRGAKEE